MAKKGKLIQCRASGEMVDAATLVRAIVPGALRERYDAERSAAAIALQPASPSLMPEVFVSYGGNSKSIEIVDKLEHELGKNGVRLLHYRKELGYKDLIRNFMGRIGTGTCVVLVISEKYLTSEYCMSELVAIAKADDLWNRIFPIVLADANIYEATGRVKYVKYWEYKKRELNDALTNVGRENLDKLHGDLELYAEIRRLIDGIVDTLHDMNALTPDLHEGTRFEEMIQRILAQINVKDVGLQT